MSTKSNETTQFWFPAKRYGWGWGVPTVWQGWAVLVAFFVLLAVAAAIFLPAQRGAFVACTSLLSLLLVAVCWAKGEPPRWRWGEK